MSEKKTLGGIFAKKKPSDSIKQKIKEEEEKLSKLTLDEKKEILIKKFLESSGITRDEADEDALSELAEGLCTKEGVKNNYLNRDFKSVVDYFKNFKTKERKNTLLKSTQEISRSETIKEEEEEPEEDLEIFKSVKVNEKIKIKLIITELAHTEKEKKLRQIISPFANALKLTPKFGMFHTALAIGPCM